MFYCGTEKFLCHIQPHEYNYIPANSEELVVKRPACIGAHSASTATGQ